MDVAVYIELVRQGLCHARPDDTWESLWRRRRLAKAKNWTFWRAVIYALKKEMELILKAPITHTWLTAYITRCVRHAFYYVPVTVLPPEGFEIDAVAIDIEASQIEASRDPPIFIPIPKLESSNGCARSDLSLFAYF
ncbi:hypothetical protein QUB77_31335 [Microcoleus sp. AT9b-C3]